MGFMDKAKKMAEQAQTKLDEVQKQFNESQGASRPAPGGPVTEYDKHGRPVTPEGVAEPTSAPPPPAPPAPAAEAPPTAAPPEQPDGADEYAPPQMTSGDPLAG